MNDMTSSKGAAQAAFPLQPASLAELGFDEPALARLRKLIRAHIEQGRYPGAQIALARHGRLALYESFGCSSCRTRRGRARRYAMAAVLEYQGHYRGGCLGAGGGRAGALLRSHCRARSRVRASWQGRHHARAGDESPRGISQCRRELRVLERPRTAAQGGVRLHARMDPGNAAAIPPAIGACDVRSADRGADRHGLSGLPAPARDRTARSRARRVCRRTGRGARALRDDLRAKRRRAEGTRAGEYCGTPTCRHPEQRRLCHGARHGRPLSDDGGIRTA